MKTNVLLLWLLLTGLVSGAFAAEPTRLTNVSVRASLAAGDTLIVGFSVAGSGAKPILVRAIGPTLASFGVTDALADPRVDLFSGSSAMGGNNDWGGGADLASRFSAVGAFALPPASRDAALMLALNAGSYTAQVGAGAGGTVLLECYDAESNTTSTVLRNVSARTFVSPGKPLTAGFALTGTEPKLMLLRGIGPALASFGVANPIADPQLRIFNSAGTLVGQSNDWSGQSGSALVLNAVGAFPLATGSRDASSMLGLMPGAYTVQVSPTGQESGTALVEIYEVTFAVPPGVTLQPVSNGVPAASGLATRADTLPGALSGPAAVYPAELRGSGVVGQVIVTFVATAEGTASDPVVLTANDVHFATAALDAVRQVRFEPARLNGQPVAVRLFVPVLFPPAN